MSKCVLGCTYSSRTVNPSPAPLRRYLPLFICFNRLHHLQHRRRVYPAGKHGLFYSVQSYVIGINTKCSGVFPGIHSTSQDATHILSADCLFYKAVLTTNDIFLIFSLTAHKLQPGAGVEGFSCRLHFCLWLQHVYLHGPLRPFGTADKRRKHSGEMMRARAMFSAAKVVVDMEIGAARLLGPETSVLSRGSGGG